MSIPYYISRNHWLQQYLPFTVLKLYDIPKKVQKLILLQQYPPFTVLKLILLNQRYQNQFVATVLTVYGIETGRIEVFSIPKLFGKVATVLIVYGIETVLASANISVIQAVATVLTVYGIETTTDVYLCHDLIRLLQ